MQSSIPGHVATSTSSLGTDFFGFIYWCVLSTQNSGWPLEGIQSLFVGKKEQIAGVGPPGNRASANVHRNSRSLPPLDLSKF